MPRPATGRRGSTLVLNLMAMSVFSLLTGIIYVAAKSQVKTVVHNMRQAQAQAIAEAGLEDALLNLRYDPTWRTGFVDKPFAGGSYTVTLTTATPPIVASTGYSEEIIFFGSAVKTVSVLARFQPSSCPYAILGNTVKISSTVDSYDVNGSTSIFFSNAHVRSNGYLQTPVACPPTLIRGDATAMGTLPDLACVEGTVASTTETFTLATVSCPTCPDVNDNQTGITPTSVYQHSPRKLNIGATDTATLAPGTYYFKQVDIRGILNVDTTSGSVTIYLGPGNFDTYAGCEINNTSMIPSRLHFVDLHPTGNTLEFKCETPLFAYLEGGHTQASIEQEFFGHVCSGGVELTSDGLFHYDPSGGVSHVGWTLGSAGSWSESYRRQ